MAEYSPTFGFEPTTTVVADYSKVAEGKEDIANAAAKAKAQPQPFDFLGVAKEVTNLTGSLAKVKNAADAHEAKEKYKEWMRENQYQPGIQLVDSIKSEISTVSDTSNFSSGYREGALSILEYGLDGAVKRKEEERVNSLVAVSAAEFSVAHQRAIKEGLPINLEEYTKRVAAERKLPINAVRDALMYANIEDDITFLNSAESVDDYLVIKADIAARDRTYAESVAFFGSQSIPVKQAVKAMRLSRQEVEKAVTERLISAELEKIDSTLANLADPRGITIRQNALEAIKKLDPSKYDSERRRVQTKIDAGLAVATNRATYDVANTIIPEAVYTKDKAFYQQQTQRALTQAVLEDDLGKVNELIAMRPSVIKDLAKEASKVIFTAKDERALGTYIDMANRLPKEMAIALMGKDAYELQEGIDVLSGFARDQDGVELSAVRLRDVVLSAPTGVEIANKALEVTFYDQGGKIEANQDLRTGAIDEYNRLYRLMYKRTSELGIDSDNLASTIKDYVEEKYKKTEIGGIEYQTQVSAFPEDFSDYAVSAIQAVHPNVAKEDIVIRGGKLVDPVDGEPVFTAYMKTAAGLQHIPNVNLSKKAAMLWRMIDEPPASLADNTDYSQFGIPMAAQAGGAMSVADLIEPHIKAVEAARGDRVAAFELVQEMMNNLVKQNGKLVDPETMEVVEQTAINLAETAVNRVIDSGQVTGIGQGNGVTTYPLDPAYSREYELMYAEGHSNIDYDFIGQFEGELKTQGYVPQRNGKAIGKSGVTISTGVDLGQWDEQGLINAGISEALINKVKPFLGLKGDEAIAAAPRLKISTVEAVELYSGIRSRMLKDLKRDWANARTSVSWNKLTPEQKTVLASVHYQYGSLPAAAPNFWSLVTQGEWDKVPNHLRNFGDEFDTRRSREAAYLEGAG